jgi:hypothetical protein
LRGTILSGSSFVRTRLDGADLRGANLQPIPESFGPAWLGVTILDGVLYDSTTLWPEGSERDDRWPVGVDPRDRGAIKLEDLGRWRRARQWIKDRASDIGG